MTRTRTVLTLVIGLLIGVACSDGIRAQAQDVIAAITADDVSYDATASALVAATVQAALDALDDRIDTHDTTLAGLDETTQTVGGTLAGINTRVAALENATVSAVAVAYDGVEGTTVQAALEALEARADALEGRADALESTTSTLQSDVETLESTTADLVEKAEAAETCGEGFYEIGTLCIETSPRDPSTWDGANSLCHADGLRLCTFGEYLLGCSTNGLKTKATPEWTSEWIDENTIIVSAMDNPSCSTNGLSTLGDSGFTAYRCCKRL